MFCQILPKCTKLCLHWDGLKSPWIDFLPAVIITVKEKNRVKFGLVKRSGKSVLPKFPKFHGLRQILPNWRWIQKPSKWFPSCCHHQCQGVAEIESSNATQQTWFVIIHSYCGVRSCENPSPIWASVQESSGANIPSEKVKKLKISYSRAGLICAAMVALNPCSMQCFGWSIGKSIWINGHFTLER